MSEDNKDYDIPLHVLSIKDRKILRELFKNARTPFSAIAKQVGLSKEVVAYRIKKLLEQRLLNGFNTVIDVSRLGWQIYFINIRFKNIDNSIEKSIAETFVNHQNITQVLKCIGNYDFIVKIFVKDYVSANELVKTIEMKFKNHIDFCNLNFVQQELPIALPFLYEPFKIKENIDIFKTGTSYPISIIELQILKALSHDARLPTTEIADKLKISRELARHHLKKLEKNNIILKYRPSAWSGSKAIGYNWYFGMLKLNQSNKTSHTKIQHYLTNHLNITYYYKSIGQYEIQFEIRLKTSDELNNILMEIRTILKDELKSYELSIILKEYKYTYFPDCLMDTKDTEKK